MAKIIGFKTYQRELPEKRPVEKRIRDFDEIYTHFSGKKMREQAARCMDCGVPFCHAGCPLGNLIPDWNDLVYQHRWEEAYQQLAATNNFPEFTGRLCPAPCEEACVLGITDPPVAIELLEKSIIEHAFKKGWVIPRPPKMRTGKRIAIVGSGPAGLAAAQQLNVAGHSVTVFERDDRIGGLLRYGIPDFKMKKKVLDRRLAILEAEGIVFKPNSHVGKNISVEQLRDFDAILLCVGATKPRRLMNLNGSELQGIHFAMDYLTRQNRICAGEAPAKFNGERIDAKGKHVIVIGGGDTASDCIGTANRQGAISVTNFDYHETPPLERPPHQPWPYWPDKLRTSPSHEEGCKREWKVLTKAFFGENGRVKQVRTVDVELLVQKDRPHKIIEIPGAERAWPADLVLIAIGFSGPEKSSWLKALGVTFDSRGNIQTDEQFRAAAPNIFAAGDGRMGQSLIVWAIADGREAARCVDEHLTGKTTLPTKGVNDLLSNVR